MSHNLTAVNRAINKAENDEIAKKDFESFLLRNRHKQSAYSVELPS